MFALELDHQQDWRNLARLCLQRKIHPDNIQWLSALAPQSLFKDAVADKQAQLATLEALPIANAQPRLSKRFFELANSVACFRSQAQWTHLYRLAYALIFEDRTRLNNPIDPDMHALIAMRKHISRDKHKMKAFARFKHDNKLDKYIAWFEPEHFILADMAPFFCKRFTNMDWSIFTPYASLHWQDKELYYKEQHYDPLNLEDETEKLWLTYYRNIFNPARLKLKAMQSEMPKKYWRNLPEAVLIHELTYAAHHRTGHMIREGGVDSQQKAQKAARLQAQQRLLREQAGEGQSFDP